MTTGSEEEAREAIRDLADELIRDLAQHAGDPDAVAAVLRDYLDRLDAHALLFVCAAATRRVFADCLTLTDRADWPTSGYALTPPTDEPQEAHR